MADLSDTSSSLRLSTGDSFAEMGITLTGGVTATGKTSTNPEMVSSLTLTAAGA